MAFQTLRTAFLPSFPLASATAPPRCALSPMQAPRMVAPLPDDTALDMFSFALSGPGIITTSAFALSSLAILFTFADVGPRKTGPVFYLLRVKVAIVTNVEIPDGSVRTLRAGETVLQLRSQEECMAVAKQLPDEKGLKYSIYQAGNGEMRLLGEFPKEANAVGRRWPQEVVQKEDSKELQARWDEYAVLGEIGNVDKEWQRFVQSMGGIYVQKKGECKLCGGVGYRRCHKCGGAGGRRNLQREFICDCEGGRRKCEWCGQS